MSRGSPATLETAGTRTPIPVSQRIGEIIAAAEDLMAKPEWAGQSDEYTILGHTAMQLVRRMSYLGRHPYLSRVVRSSPIPVTRGPISIASDGTAALEGLYTPQMLGKAVELDSGRRVVSSYSLLTPIIGNKAARSLIFRHHVSRVGNLGDYRSLEPNNVTIVVPDTDEIRARTGVFPDSDEESADSAGGLIDYEAFATNHPDLAGKRRPNELAVIIPLGVAALAADAIDPPGQRLAA